MATTASWYGLGLVQLARGDIGLLRDTLKATLHTATLTPDLDTHDFFDDATNELTTASGYTAGGVTLANKALTYDRSTTQARFDFDDPAWTFTAGVTFKHMVIRKALGGAASADPLIAVVTWDVAQTVSGGWGPGIDPTGMLSLRRT